ncbi:sporulation protein [Paenibacillus swuensis]|uniref:Sporulation protein n=1 Tax=Paenibacillus swuensis TaxID=1178515 RepID=A0A172TDZ2_9BACL|nr:spore protease YyaC [Paenibacillus swuensis]ANE45144.1 sporulation protein [Paenibacillus swuensis]
MSEQSYSFRAKISGEQLPTFFSNVKVFCPSLEDLYFVCIGTDRSTGDSLGPLTGTFLKEAGYTQVIGTLDAPCDASNLAARLQQIPKGATVIAIDACLGRLTSVGFFQVANQPLVPGESVGKQLPHVGDFSIAAIVNADGPKKYWILQNTSLHFVVTMAKHIVIAIQRTYPVSLE